MFRSTLVHAPCSAEEGSTDELRLEHSHHYTAVLRAGQCIGCVDAMLPTDSVVLKRRQWRQAWRLCNEAIEANPSATHFRVASAL